MVEKITAYQFSKRFKKGYKNLPKEIQKAFDEKFPLFLKQTSHPSLRVKRIQGTKNLWEGSITMKYRFTFEFLNSLKTENEVLFRAIGTHDILKNS
jgi:mRNA-degrading endonuclease RelE of RelBE toxin-antitoxin system